MKKTVVAIAVMLVVTTLRMTAQENKPAFSPPAPLRDVDLARDHDDVDEPSLPAPLGVPGELTNKPHEEDVDEPILPPAPPGVIGGPVAPLDYHKAAIIAAVHYFAAEGEVEYLRAFLDKHPTLVNAPLMDAQKRKPKPDDGYKPLHRAAAHGQLDTVKLLLERKADVNADGGNGWTPLHVGAEYGHVRVCRWLLQHGANARAVTDALPERSLGGEALRGPNDPPARLLPAQPGRTPLDVARHNKQQTVVDLLLAHMKKETSRLGK